MDSESQQNLERLKELSAAIDTAEAVLETIDTKGWKEYLGPILDKMIYDVVGGKLNDRWYNGSFGNKSLGEVKATNLLWYKHGLTEFHANIFSHIDTLEANRGEYERIVKEEMNKDERPVESSYTEPEGQEEKKVDDYEEEGGPADNLGASDQS